MRVGMLLTAGAGLFAIAACSRSTEPPPPPGVQVNSQTGIVKAGGIEANGLSAAGECLSPEEARQPPSAFPPERRRQIVACINGSLARQVNPQLPKLIDPVTRLDRLSTEGATLIYHYTVMRAASSLPPDLVRNLETQTRTVACGQPAARQTIEMGGAYGYRWVDSQSVPIHQMTISAC